MIVLDVETTGLKKGTDRIIEVTAFKYENNFEPVSAFTTLINPTKPISKEATEINHITDDMVSDAPTFSEIGEQLQNYIDGCNIAGYNLSFDMAFLYAAGIVFSDKVKYYDVCAIARSIIKKNEIDNYKLATVCGELNIDTVQLHRSFSDAYCTGRLFEKFYNYKQI